MLLLPARCAGRKTLLLAGILRSLARRPRWGLPRAPPSPQAASEAVSPARGLASVPALLAGPPTAGATAAAILCTRLQAFSPLPHSAAVLLQQLLPVHGRLNDAATDSLAPAVGPSAIPEPAAAPAPPASRGTLLDYAMLGVEPARAARKPSLSDEAALLAYAQLA